MEADQVINPPSKVLAIIGWILSAILAVFFMLGIVFLLTMPGMVRDGMVKYGYPDKAVLPLILAELVGALLYLIPSTAVLGAVILTGYLGGAVATHVRAGESFLMPLLFGVLLWLALIFRDARLRSLLPLRK